MTKSMLIPIRGSAAFTPVTDTGDASGGWFGGATGGARGKGVAPGGPGGRGRRGRRVTVATVGRVDPAQHQRLAELTDQIRRIEQRTSPHVAEPLTETTDPQRDGQSSTGDGPGDGRGGVAGEGSSPVRDESRRGGGGERDDDAAIQHDRRHDAKANQTTPTDSVIPLTDSLVLPRGALHEWFTMAGHVTGHMVGDVVGEGVGPVVGEFDDELSAAELLKSLDHRACAAPPPMCLLSELAWRALHAAVSPGQAARASSASDPHAPDDESHTPRGDSQAASSNFPISNYASVAWKCRQASLPGGAALLPGGDPDRWVVWIGRRAWPWPATLVRHAQSQPHLLQRSLFIDPPDRGAALWAMDLCLRSSAVAAIVADAEGFDLPATRRLAIAARAGRTAGLLIRPLRDHSRPSAAFSRWLVRSVPAPAEAARPRWSLHLLRCKRPPELCPHAPSRAEAEPLPHPLLIEWHHETGLVFTPAALARPAHRTPPESKPVARQYPVPTPLVPTERRRA